jgi:rhodanese-related sulfurtransferase
MRRDWAGTVLPEDAVILLVLDHPTAVICGSGYRSSAVASLLKRHGYHNVVNIPGGMQAWMVAGMATVTA